MEGGGGIGKSLGSLPGGTGGGPILDEAGLPESPGQATEWHYYYFIATTQVCNTKQYDPSLC